MADPAPSLSLTATGTALARQAPHRRGEQVRRLWSAFARNRLAVIGLGIVVAFIFVAVFAPLLAPYDPNKQTLRHQLQTSSSTYWLGTDDVGRDILSRIIIGSRISLTVGLIATGIGAGIGTLAGLLAGYYRQFDGWIMRCMDILLSFPSVLLAVAIIAVLGPGIGNVMIAVGINSIPAYARLVRSTVLSLKGAEFVMAARAIGTQERRIMMRHILPNCLSPIIVYSTLQIGGAILTASILSFLGFGVQPPDAEWGQMVNAGRGWLQQAPHIATYPGLAIFFVVMGFNLLGDGLRDILDPRMRTSG
jgi:ABC-type dipeptide/oligopeptide/nickel transport system permease subunit